MPNPPHRGSGDDDDDDDTTPTMGEKTRLQMLLRPRPRHQTTRRRPLRQTALVLGTLLAVYYLVYIWHTPTTSSTTTTPNPGSWTTTPEDPKKPTTKASQNNSNSNSNGSGNGRPPPEILNNLSLDTEQCEAYFPGLTREIEEVVAEGPFQVRQTGDMGPLQGRIRDGKVCFFCFY